ncbi:MAG: hypothetical protein VKO21_06585 [Candidatus Sericytochromatia bacterium]|nr:hypothetical protein [Candidatus Sericytochromatia bacterium]
MTPRQVLLGVALILGLALPVRAGHPLEPLALLAVGTLAMDAEIPALDLHPAHPPLAAWAEDGRLGLGRLEIRSPAVPPTTEPESELTSASSSATPGPRTVSWVPESFPGPLEGRLQEIAFAGAAASPWLVTLESMPRATVLVARSPEASRSFILQRSPGNLERLTTAWRSSPSGHAMAALWRVMLGPRRNVLATRAWTAAGAERLRWLPHGESVPEQPVLAPYGDDGWLASWREEPSGQVGRVLAATWREGQPLPRIVPLASGPYLLGPILLATFPRPLIGWQGPDPLGHQIHARWADPPTPRPHPDLRTDLSAEGPDLVKVSSDGRGRLLVAWSQKTGPETSETALMARVHGHTGAAVGPPVLLEVADEEVRPLAVIRGQQDTWWVGWGRRETAGWTLRVAHLGEDQRP